MALIPPTRLQALDGIEAMVTEDAERCVREQMDLGLSWRDARDAYHGWIVEKFGAAADRGADLCR